MSTMPKSTYNFIPSELPRAFRDQQLHWNSPANFISPPYSEQYHYSSFQQYPVYSYYHHSFSACALQEYVMSCPPSRRPSPPLLEHKEMDEKFYRLLDELFAHPAPCVDRDEIRRLRSEVLTCLNNLAVYWIGRQAERLSLERSQLEKTVFVKAFGSHGLGLTTYNSDLDAVLVAPRYVTREEVFRGFVELLRQQENVKEVCPVENTFVPVIKFLYYGIEVDLTFAALRTTSMPDDASLLSDDILRDMDEKSVKSLNGWRVSRYLLSYVPDVKVFRAVLTFVKHWAMQRLIYSNTLGYLGGVSWAILVAHICRVNAGMSVRKHVKSFFKEFSEWNWQSRPVNINQADNPYNHIEGFVGLDAYMMPIITPCKPYQNSSFNVTRTTFHNIRQEMRSALAVLRADNHVWADVLATRNPLDEYEMFLTVISTAKCESSLHRWRGVVESKLRPMLPNLEKVNGMQRCQIFPQIYKLSDGDWQDTVHCAWIIGIDYVHPNQMNELSAVVREFRQNIQYYNHFNGSGSDQNVTVLRKTSAKLRETLTVYASSDPKK
ncbi:poly(A) polymerase type 3-like [Paramacrobiotus metropolitanus]|uniref:poly(A) polymerase type 3-like n=1 Tax=Paramacrobiotus metropolitanus TaxID=2943436 RepID=UPI0024464CA7|nr:poly(A) polymerase type 3-like [Paramacrobiotus metropolitanus]